MDGDDRDFGSDFDSEFDDKEVLNFNEQQEKERLINKIQCEWIEKQHQEKKTVTKLEYQLNFGTNVVTIRHGLN